MPLPTIDTSDMAALNELGAQLDFADHERAAVLLENASRDVNAAPGSGKTTVLTAKLWLLARKWVSKHQGICMLSHTNVAREEIERRVGATPEGARLLGHPHYIGTIHGFVNEFLALPMLRSTGGAVACIDDDVFARRARALAEKQYSIKSWAQNDGSVMPMVESLVYRGAGLALASQTRALPKAHSKTYPLLADIKAKLTDQGVFRFADMFAFASRLLTNYPETRHRLSLRFPVVFIDEMQDTAWYQEELLATMFDDSVVVQRYGDANQRILGDGGDEESSKLTFPRPDALPISTSKRFGPTIAKLASTVCPGGLTITGQGIDLHPPLLLLYDTARVGDVIKAFGRQVLGRFTDAQLAQGSIKALCARKSTEAKQLLGRALPDYWPGYGGGPPRTSGETASIWPLMGTARTRGQGSGMQAAAEDARRAVQLMLRAAGSPALATTGDGPFWMQRLRESGRDLAPLRHVIRDIALSSGWSASDESRDEATAHLHRSLVDWIPADMGLAAFRALSVFEPPEGLSHDRPEPFSCDIALGARRVSVGIGTVASMKGQTHLATLVLEALGHPSKRFDLAEALPVLAGQAPPNWKETVQPQMRLLYVAMSRPKSFLCLAANAARVHSDCVKALQGRGWDVQHLTAPP
jgi:DNA helicase-2/ATP-dependent DNA helicase PcrA